MSKLISVLSCKKSNLNKDELERNESSYHHKYFPNQLNSFFLTVVNENFSINKESVIS